MSTSLFKLVMPVLIIISSLSAKAGHDGNGGDVFDVETSKQVWDEVEHGDPFSVLKLPEYKSIKDLLIQLKPIIPHTIGAILESFRNNLWYFVSPPLRQTNESEESVLELTYKKTRVALNKDGAIYIRKEIWDELSPRSRAFLLLHETLWTLNRNVGNGRNAQVSPAAHRELVGLLLNPFTKDMGSTALKNRLDKLTSIEHHLHGTTPLLNRYVWLDKGSLYFELAYETIDQTIIFNVVHKFATLDISKVYDECGFYFMYTDETETQVEFKMLAANKKDTEATELASFRYPHKDHQYIGEFTSSEKNILGRLMKEKKLLCKNYW